MLRVEHIHTHKLSIRRCVLLPNIRILRLSPRIVIAIRISHMIVMMLMLIIFLGITEYLIILVHRTACIWMVLCENIRSAVIVIVIVRVVCVVMIVSVVLLLLILSIALFIVEYLLFCVLLLVVI